MMLTVGDTGKLGKQIPSSPNMSRTYDLPITSSDALYSLKEYHSQNGNCLLSHVSRIRTQSEGSFVACHML